MIAIICQKHPITVFILFSTLSVFATWFLLLIVIMDRIWKCRSKLGLYLKLSRLLIGTRVQIPIGRQMLLWETVMFIRPMCVQDFQPFLFLARPGLLWHAQTLLTYHVSVEFYDYIINLFKSFTDVKLSRFLTGASNSRRWCGFQISSYIIWRSAGQIGIGLWWTVAYRLQPIPIWAKSLTFYFLRFLLR